MFEEVSHVELLHHHLHHQRQQQQQDPEERSGGGCQVKGDVFDDFQDVLLEFVCLVLENRV